MRRDPLVRLLALCRPEAGRLALALAAGVAAAASAIGLIATSAWLISRAAEHPPVLDLMVAVVAVRAFGVGRGLFRYGERLAAHDAAFRVLGDVRARTFAALERLAPTGLPAFRRGDLMTRLIEDVDAVPDVLVRGLLPSAVAAITGGASVVLLWTILPAAGLALLAGLLAVAVAAPAVQAATAARADARIAPLRAESVASTTDLLAGLNELVVCGAAPRRLAGLAATDARLRAAEARSSGSAGLAGALVALAGGAVVWAGLALGTPAVRSGALHPVLLAVLVLTPIAVFEVVADLPAAVRSLLRARSCAARLFEVLDATPPVAEPADPAPLPAGPLGLSLRGVGARWPGGPAVLTDVDLELAPGRRVAVVGPSGSGKSTLVALLLRFLDPSTGSVRLHAAGSAGVDLRDLGAAGRREVALCEQNPHMFDTTLAENLRVARRDATDADVADALRRAGLADWVGGLPAGLATPVGEFGTRLSGGQLRRLALARALLSGAGILVLDEPTEHLEAPMADALTRDILDATDGRAVLLVTHRLTGLDRVDEIVVLDAGRVVERGTHADLVREGGAYARRWRLETGACVPSG